MIEKIKIFIVCIIVFIGAGFAIMTFNEDVAVSDLFEKLYIIVDGTSGFGIKILQISYSIGIALGITIFYNRFGKSKNENEPTPIELKMRQYEEDVNEYNSFKKDKLNKK